VICVCRSQNRALYHRHKRRLFSTKTHFHKCYIQWHCYWDHCVGSQPSGPLLNHLCPSVCTLVRTRNLLIGFLWNFILGSFAKMCWHIPVFVEIEQHLTRTLHGDRNPFSLTKVTGWRFLWLFVKAKVQEPQFYAVRVIHNFLSTVVSRLSGLIEGGRMLDNWETRIIRTLYFTQLQLH
jgi:hypothetical protein